MRAVQQDTPAPNQIPRLLIAIIAVALGFAGILLMRGEGGPWAQRAISVTLTLIQSGWAPCLYLLAGAGYGRIARAWFPQSRARWCIELGVGLTLLLSITHMLGMLGLLSTISAWVIAGAGLVLFAPRLWEKHDHSPNDALSPIHIAIVCGIMLALVMACSPPGVLWGSEYGGFDALSYHLQLPREWIEQGQIWPSEHNVYSFLPGYIESAYAHIALMMGGGMLANDGRALMSAQILSALMLILSAGVIGELGRAACARVLPDRDEALAGRIAIALTLGTPWLMVVGTLAYNEIAVVLLGGAAIRVALLTDIAAWKRAAVCGLIVGGACSCKPTALFLLAPSVGIVLLACAPRKQWVIATLTCIAAGGLTIAPWLIRNELATGNPVFPQMAGVFGQGHWNDAQHAIYAAAHRFDGSLVERFAMLVVPDSDANTHVSRFRGLTNGQWALTPLLAVVGLITLLMRRRSRAAGIASLLVVGIPIVAWAMLTHLQSRFLIPLAPALIVLGAMAIVRIPSAPAREAVAKVVCLIAIAWSVGLALVQNRGNPFILIDLGPSYALGSLEGLEGEPWTASVNRVVADGETVYLLGDATPIYVRGDVRYNTVYDRWLIEDAIAAAPDSPRQWTIYLREQGIAYVVVGLSEIGRYAESGWLPDSITPERMNEWMESLGQPILIPGDPTRVMFRLSPDERITP